jgi:tetratricopeptide (TPR) repeat protein
MEELIQKAERMILENRYDDALELLEKMLVDEPDHREALRLAGIAYMERGEEDKALKALEYYLRRWGRAPKVLEALGCAHFKLGNYGTSRNLLEEAEACDPDCASIERNIGVVYHKLGDVDNSFRCLQHSNELVPDDYRTMYALAMAYLEFHRSAEAKELLKEMLNLPIPEDFRRIAQKYLENMKD